MHKTLEDTYWSRLKLLIRGLLFYNTIYWRRASDGLNPPKLTRAERKAYAPPKDPEVVKPRVKPRARIDQARRNQMLQELSRLRFKLPPAIAGTIPASAVPQAIEQPLPLARPMPAPLAPLQAASSVKGLHSPPSGMPMKRRRKRRVPRTTVEKLASRSFLARILDRLT